MIPFPVLLFTAEASTSFADLLKALGLAPAQQEQVQQVEPDGVVQPVEGCDNPATQQRMNECAALEYQQADALLAEQWRLAVDHARMADDAAQQAGEAGLSYDKLLNAQRAWIFFRDAQCDAEGHAYRGGSIEPLIVSSCKLELTRTRITQLKAMREV